MKTKTYESPLSLAIRLRDLYNESLVRMMMDPSLSFNETKKLIEESGPIRRKLDESIVIAHEAHDYFSGWTAGYSAACCGDDPLPCATGQRDDSGPIDSCGDAEMGDTKDDPKSAFESGITGFVVCVNDEPYPDTFSEDASITWQLFLPILEADPGLGNEDVRLVRLVEE